MAEAPTHSMFTLKAELIAAASSGGLLLVGFVLERAAHLPQGSWLVWASLAIGTVYGGRPALDSIKARKFDIDVLMVVGALLSAALKHPEEGALLLFLFNLSGALEDLAMRRTEREVKALHKLMPTDALVWRGGAWIESDAKSLVAGERVKVRPGERVPADCVVEVGSSSMDQSAITGESMPREVKPGDELYAGTINTDDALECKVTRAVAESSLQRILDLVTKASEAREPVQRTIDKLSEPYATGVLVISLITVLVWKFALARPWDASLMTAITLLIVASPCALIIATPTATLAAIARGARGGVLFKGGHSLELLSTVGAVCFDKTGTLTIGRPRLYEVHPVAWSDGNELLALATGLEADSTHPIATAVREAAKERGVEAIKLDRVSHTAGRGLEGEYQGRLARLGSFKHTQSVIPVCFRNRVQEVLTKIQERGHIGVVIAQAASDPSDPSGRGGQAAVLIMADAVRPGAHTLVRELHALHVKPVRMLTGDNTATAARVATSLELDRFDAELMPQDKLDLVGELRKSCKNEPGRTYRGVAVIGDGVNDAPALAAADVGLAIGAIGTAAALESADIVLLSDNLGAVPWAVRLARRARRTVKSNLGFALAVIALVGSGVLIGSYANHPIPLWIGVLAHEGGTLLVVLNSLRLLTFPKLALPNPEDTPRRTPQSVPEQIATAPPSQQPAS